MWTAKRQVRAKPRHAPAHGLGRGREIWNSNDGLTFSGPKSVRPRLRGPGFGGISFASFEAPLATGGELTVYAPGSGTVRGRERKEICPNDSSL